MAETVHIVALTARTPVGLNAESSAAAVRGGISRISQHPFVVDGAGEPVHFARDARIEPQVSGWRRLALLATAALDQILRKLDRVLSSQNRVSVSLAVPESRPGFQDADAASLARELANQVSTKSLTTQVEIAARGHAGGLHALDAAAKAIAQRRTDLSIVGGVDSYFDGQTLRWLSDNRQLAANAVRSGLIPGEAAGFVALTSGSVRRQLQLASLAIVRGTGTAVESKLIKTDAVNSGEGLASAIREAARGLAVPREVVDAIYCDVNGERYRSEEWGFAVLREQNVLRDCSYLAPANCWGDVGAASGPLLVNLAVQAWSRRYAAGPVALVWAGSERGLRGAAVLGQPEGR